MGKLSGEEKGAAVVAFLFFLFWLAWIGLIAWGIVSLVIWITSK